MMQIANLGKISVGQKDLSSAPCEICGLVKKDCAVIHKEAVACDGTRFKVYALLCGDHFSDGDFFKGKPDEAATKIIETVEMIAFTLSLDMNSFKTVMMEVLNNLDEETFKKVTKDVPKDLLNGVMNIKEDYSEEVV